MNKKVKLPSEVAKAIDFLRTRMPDHYIVVTTYDGESYSKSGNAREIEIVRTHFLEKSNVNLMSVLVNGYDGEKTPEEILRDYFVEQELLCENFGPYDGSYNEGQLEGIERTLEILGIKIEGVNA